MKVFLIFLAFCINLYGNLVSTNGKIGMYFDQEEMMLKSIRGDIFEKVDMAIVDMGILIDNKAYTIREHINSVRIIPNTNIIMINSNIEDTKLTTLVFASAINREKLYVNTIIRKKDENSKVKLLYRMYPYKNINILSYNSPKDYYLLDDFRMKSLNNPMGMYLSNEEFQEGFKFREIREKTIRYQDDKLLLASDIQGNGKIVSDVLIINFGEKEWKNKIEFKPQIIKNEYNYWKDWNWDFQNYPQEVREQLTQLRMITMGSPIPANLSHTMSQEELRTNLKLSRILSLYGKNEDSLEILKRYKFHRKNTAEDVAILLSLIKSWEDSKDIVSELYIRSTIFPIIQRTLDGIDEEGRFVLEEDSVANYYYLSMILTEILENRSEIDYISSKEIESKLELLKKYIGKNYMTPEGLKDTPGSLNVNPKNIEYIDLYPEEVRKLILEDEYNRYYNKRIGLLMFPGDEFVDIEYNLTFARYLYNNSLEKNGEQIFARVRELVNENNNYITPRMHTFEKNEAGIYGDLIFSYLLTYYFRGID